MSPEQHRLQALIDELDAQRALLGNAAAEAALAPLRDKLAALSAQQPSAAADAQTLRQVTILFLDIVDSTALSQHLDPEDIHAVMDGMLGRCARVVGSHGGKVLQYAGDSVLSVFGAAESREDDAERAVRAGLALLDEARHQADEVRERHGHAGFNVRVGIHTGPVLLGGGVDADNSIRGMAVNIAARLEQAAPPGTLRISRDTYRHVRGVFDVQPQPPLTVKGIDEPVITYLVQRAKQRTFRDTRRGIEGLDTPMLGRDAELASLGAAFETAKRQCRLVLVTVVADAGLGKSRLVAEFEQWLELRPERIRTFRGRGEPRSIDQPYGVLRDLLFWRFEIQDGDSLDQAQAKFAAGLAPVFGDRADEQTALLGQLIGLDYRASPHIAGIVGDGRQLRARAFHAGVDYFGRLGGDDPAPIVLLLDDLQWADDASLDFIEHLARGASDRPMLVLCAARPVLFERRPRWGEGSAHGMRIDLASLDADTRQAFADALLQRIDDPPAVLRELLSSSADGNPFYMEELTAMLIDDGVIVTRTPRWQVVPERLLAAHVPTTLTGVLQARIDALPAAERQALQQASVIGPLFWDEALAQLHPQSPLALPSLGRRNMVLGHEISAFEHTGEFAFNHHLLHQVTYDGVLKRHKREQHRITALWLEQRCAGRTNEYLGLLAEHFERAGVNDRALHYWSQAAEEAVHRFADGAALAHADRALALEAGTDAPRRFMLMNLREGVFARRTARDAQADAIAELERLAEQLDDDAKRSVAAQRRAWFLFMTGAIARAMEAAQRAIVWAGTFASGDAARAHNAMLASLARLGRFDEARAQGLVGLEIARAAGDRQVQAHLLNNLASVAMDSGDVVECARLNEQAVAVFREIGSRWGLAGALGNLANLSMLSGRYHLARTQLEDNLRLCAEVGNRGSEANGRSCLAQVLLELGDPAAALESAEAALRIARDIGDRYFEATSLTGIGHAFDALGRSDPAREQHAAARDVFDAIGMPHSAMEPMAAIARVALAAGDIGAAIDQVDAILVRQAAVANWNGSFSVRLLCWQVLAAARDPRAADLLAHARVDLLASADRINDPAVRKSFLDNVSAHRQIIEAAARAEPQGLSRRSRTERP